MPPLGKLVPHLENRMRDCKIFLYPEIAQPKHSWQMARLGELVGLGRSAGVSSWPHFKDNRPNLRGGRGCSQAPGPPAPAGPLGAGSAGVAAGRVDLGHRPVSRVRPGESLMVRRRWPDCGCRLRPALAPSVPVNGTHAHADEGITANIMCEMQRLLGSPAGSCHYHKTFHWKIFLGAIKSSAVSSQGVPACILIILEREK